MNIQPTKKQIVIAIDLTDEADAEAVQTRLNATWWVWEPVMTLMGYVGGPPGVDPQTPWDESEPWEDQR